MAAGEPLPLAQEQLRIDGHALEARIYAENPDKQFLPSTGTLRYLRTPAAVQFMRGGAVDGNPHGPAGVRIDAGVREGDTISPYYDPMIAADRVGRDCDEALARMRRAGGLPWWGCRPTWPSCSGWWRARPSRRRTGHRADRTQPGSAVPAGGAGGHGGHRAGGGGAAGARGDRAPRRRGRSPLALGAGAWRLNGDSHTDYLFGAADGELRARLQATAAGEWLRFDGRSEPFRAVAHDGSCTGAGRPHAARPLPPEDDAVHVFRAGMCGSTSSIRCATPVPPRPMAAAGGADARRIIAVMVEAGKTIRKGDPLVVMEAMKMEHTLTAPADGVVGEVLYAVGDRCRTAPSW